tara:strand:+ start:3554 stop:3901 length:348 start_codon:yes stop_codon:yes gene_type:complete
MSREDERIDTSKYNGHTTTHWSARNQGDGSLESCDDDYEHDEPFIETDGGNVAIVYHRGGSEIHPLEEKRANMRLMADASKILAELKRCYEEIDRLHDREINTLREMHRLTHSPE